MALQRITLPKLVQEYQRLARDFWPAVKRGMLSAGLRGESLLKDLSNTYAFDRGHYRYRWKHAVVPSREGNGSNLVFYNDAPYAAVIEFGRRAGAKMPPPYVLDPWVKRHFTMTVVTKKGKTRTRKPKKDEIPGLAFILAKSIQENGIEGKHILTEKAHETLIEYIEEEVTKELEKELAGGR